MPEVTDGKLTTKNFAENEKGVLSLAQWINLQKVKDLKFYNTVNSVKIIEKAREL